MVYLCLADHVVHTPIERPDAWMMVETSGGLPSSDDDVLGGEEPETGDEAGSGAPIGGDVADDGSETENVGSWEPWDGNNDSLHKAGDVVLHGGKIWRSTADDNHWEPGVYGWVEVN